MKNFILSIFILMAASGIVRADAVTFEATVNSPRISLDEVLQLTLTVTGFSGNLNPVSLPVIDGFTAKYLGPSTSVSIINGNYHSERSFIYNLFPHKAGRFQIPPISATIGGGTYTTKPIDVEVFSSSAASQQASSGPAGQNQAPSAESLKDRVLIKVWVDKTQVYLNERIALTIKLLVNGVPMRDIQYPQFDKSGFIVDDFEKPEQSSQVLDGVRYDTVEFKTNIYPDHLGDLTLGPVQIAGNVLYKTGQGNPFDQDNDFFGGNVFNNFFDSYAAHPVTMTSRPIGLHVLSLPQEGRPRDFSGAIGRFDFQAGVSPVQVKAGDPLTLKIQVQGSGNFKNMKMPVFQAPGFKSYEPQIKDTAEGKTAEQVIIPLAAGIKQVPALHFSYFDTSLKDYKTMTQGPFAVKVAASSPEQEFKAVGFSDMSRESPASAMPQFSWSKMFKDIYQILSKLGRSIWFWMSLGIIFVAGVSFLLWRRFQDRLKNDPAFARRLKAAKEARQALGPAQGLISTERPKDFYALLSRVLRDYLANKWHQSSAALSIEEISRRLKTVQLDDAHIAQVRALLEEADLVCFAGAHRDAAQMRANLSQVQGLIAYLEKFL